MHDLFAPLLTWQLAAAAGVVLLAGIVRGFSGFGSALILTPSLALLYGPEQAVPLVIVLEAVLSVQMIRDGWRGADRREVAVLGIAAIVAIPLGTWILIAADPVLLRWAISLGILAFLVALAAGWRHRGATSRTGLAITGALSGALNGAAGVPGPPILLYYLGGGKTSAALLRANVILFFFLLDCVTLPWMAIQGLVTVPVLLIAAMILPAAMLGVVVGTRLFPYATDRHFRLIAYLIIGAVAILTLPVG